MPVYNEEATVSEILRRVFAVRIAGWKKEVIVVDDGSTDGTRAALKRWEGKAIVIFQKKNQGKGSAITAGLLRVTGDIVLIQDADLEYNPQDYPTLLAPFDDTRIHVVYGSRFLGPHLTTMFVYEVGNKFITFVTNLLFNTNITDVETGYKVFRHKVLAAMTLRAKRFDFEPEVTVKLLKAGYQIYEVPISYFGRKFSEGKKLTWKDGVMAIWTLLVYRFFP